MYRLFCIIACALDPRNSLPPLVNGLSKGEIDEILAESFLTTESRGKKWTRQTPTELTMPERRERRAFFAMKKADQDRYLELLWVLAQEPLNLDATPFALEYNQRFYS